MINPFAQASNPFTHYAKEMEETVKKADDYLKQNILASLNNPQGEQLLDTLEDMFIRQPVSPPGSKEGYGYFREGQNHIILMLRRIINQSKQEATK